MKIFKDEYGFTLVEILIAVTILAISVFAFTTLFTGSFTGIFNAGHKSDALFKAQEEMDNIISENTGNGEEVLVIVFDQKTISVSGEKKIIPYEHEGRKGNLHYFLP